MLDGIRKLFGSRPSIPDLPSGIVTGSGVGQDALISKTLVGGSYPVRDLVKAVRWYGEVFGLKVSAKTDGRAGFAVDGPPFEVHVAPEGSREPPGAGATFVVGDLGRTRKVLKNVGASLVGEEPAQGDGFPVLLYRDRDGNVLRVTSRR
jgi:catechol 2,3-dioxygenase-like lactoylglutathione lyase family enzyme